VHAPNHSDLQTMITNFRTDPGVAAAEKSMPETIRTDLLGNSSQYLLGFIEGVARSLQTLQRVDASLKAGNPTQGAAVRTMLSVAVLISAEELIRREEADATKA
jgi:hypothetical protein